MLDRVFDDRAKDFRETKTRVADPPGQKEMWLSNLGTSLVGQRVELHLFALSVMRSASGGPSRFGDLPNEDMGASNDQHGGDPI